MGLLDWLTDGIGSMGSGSGSPLPTQSMPPMMDLNQNSPPMSPPMAPAGDTGLPPGTPVPLPMARPPGADAGALPPNAAPTGGALPPPGAGTGMPPGPPPPLTPTDAADAAQSYQRAGGNLAPPPDSGQNVGPIGRALGLNPNQAAQLRGSLASGLKSVGENWNKPGLAAFAGSAGSAMEGADQARDKTTDQQSKYLKDAIAATQAGDLGKLNVARTKLALAQAKAAEAGKDTKASIMNSPERLYLSGLKAVADQTRGSLATLRATESQFGVGSKEAKAALATHEDLVSSTKKTVFTTLGVSEKDAAKIGKQPGFAADNPIPKEGLTKEKFDALPPGSYFINPKDNRLLIKQPPAGANPTPQAQSPTPAAPPPITAPAGSAADNDE